MAKHQVTFSCGHVEIEQLNGNRRDRERRIKWMEQNMVCSDCYAQRKQEWREKNAANALGQAKKMIADNDNQDGACLNPLDWE